MLALALGFVPSACKDNSKSDQPGAGEAKPDQPASDQPAANADEADRAVKTIHRIDAELLKAELTTDDYPQV